MECLILRPYFLGSSTPGDEANLMDRCVSDGIPIPAESSVEIPPLNQNA
jgi:hypothetical protein